MAVRILVTGGAGYLGSVLIPELLNAGHHVTALDNFMYKQNSLAHVCSNPRFDVVNGDVRIKSVLAPLIKKADVIIPLAAYVGAPLCEKDPIGASSVNRDSVLMLLGMAAREQCILMPTTNSAYGTGDKNNFCTEESELRPISRYAKDKVEIESALMQRENSISFRLATVFGMSPRMRIDLLVNDFTYRGVHERYVLLFEPHFKRNYIHIRDVARVFLHGMEELDMMKGQIFNVGLSDTNISKWELCEAIKRHLPGFVFLEAPVGKDPDQRNYVVSNAKVEATGFSSKYSLDDGISELIKGFTMIKKTGYSNV